MYVYIYIYALAEQHFHGRISTREISYGCVYIYL